MIVILGLDGLSVDDLTEAMNRASLPHFRKLVSKNSPYRLKSVYPYVTAPAWASIFSGVNPGKHGIFEMFEVDGVKRRPSNLRKSSVPFLWDYLSWAGKKVLVMGVPFVYPAPKVNGIFVTGRFVPKISSFPDELQEAVDLQGYRYDDIETESKIEAMIAGGAKSASKQQLLELKKRVSTSLALLDSGKWDAAIFVDSLPDEVFHFSYDDESIVDEMFALLDYWIGEITRRLEEGDTLLIVSDHGFTKIRKVLFINEWLNDRGYLRIPQSPLSRSIRTLGFDLSSLEGSRSLTSMYGFLSKYLPFLSRFIKNSMRNQLLLDDQSQLDAKVEAFGINEPVAWLHVRDDLVLERLVIDLQSLKDSGLIKTFGRVDRYYHGTHVGEAPGQFLIESRDGWAIDAFRLNNGRVAGKPLLTKKGVHSLFGIFAVYGKHQDANISPVVYDVVPTVLHLMRLPIPRFIDGSSVLKTMDGRGSDWLDVTKRF